MGNSRSVRKFLFAALFLSLALCACREDISTALPRLTKQLESKETSVRNKAALEIAGYGEAAKETVPALARRLGDSNAGVRTSAAYALRAIGTPEAQKALDSYKR